MSFFKRFIGQSDMSLKRERDHLREQLVEVESAYDKLKTSVALMIEAQKELMAVVVAVRDENIVLRQMLDQLIPQATTKTGGMVQ